MNPVFGPVHSRRFGVSLGIDLSPMQKQCNLDCIYCELAPAKTVAAQQQSLAPETIVAALQDALTRYKDIDIITVTANGEPTLYPYLDELITLIRKITDKKLLILTNSVNLIDTKVFRTLLRFDAVKLSLDALSKNVFKKIDRPREDIDIERVRTALASFAEAYEGELYIEILFVKGINDKAEEITKLNDFLKQIPRKRIDIGTIDRPPAYSVEALDYERLYEIAKLFDPALPVHIATRKTKNAKPASYDEDAIRNTLDKRPLTPSDVAILFDTPSQKRLEAMLRSKKVLVDNKSGIEFYVLAKNLRKNRKNS